MANWWDNLGTSIGDSMISMADPFGALNPSDPMARQNAIRQGVGAMGAGMLANSRKRPMEAFGLSFQNAQEMGQRNSLNALQAQQLQLGMENARKDMAWEGTERQKTLEERDAEEQRNEDMAAYIEQQMANPGIPQKNKATAMFFMKAGEYEKAYQALTGAQENGEYGVTPVYGQDANGNRIIMQMNKGGGARQVELPEGVTLSPGVDKVDLGTAWGIVDRDGNVVDTIPKDLRGAAEQTELGKLTGEAAGLAASLASKLPGLQQVVDELGVLADQATYTQVGQAYNTVRKELGLSPTDAAVARAKYIAMVDNQVLPMLRDTFGAQFTVKEGETLRATLGDPNKTPEEKKAVLEAFIEQKVRNIEAAAQQGNVDPAQAQPGPQGMPDVSTMSDQELEAIINGP